MAESNVQFTEFNPASKADWVNQIEKELKGGEFSSLLFPLRDGITLQPAYTSEDRPDIGPLPSRPFDHRETVEVVEVGDEKSTNVCALDKLNKGASALLFFLPKGVDLKTLLNNVLIEHIAIHYVSDGEALDVHNQLVDLVKERGLDPSQIRGSINADPVENFLRSGKWFKDSTGDFETLATLTQSELPQLKTLCINANLYHNAGATPGQELGIALAQLKLYTENYGEDSRSRIWLNMAIGREYLVEVSKFRAIRYLWHKLQTEWELTPLPLTIYAENGLRNKTIFDPHVNMLRTTIEAMSALLGGADELYVTPYDLTFRTPSPLGSRVARNQALVLQYEAFAGKVNDPAYGSYTFDSLTNQLCEAGWNFFRSIETQGGLLSAVESGWLQGQISQAADEEQTAFDSGKINLVGTNKYPRAEEKMNDQISAGMFAIESASAMQLVPKRLSESMERERLNSELS